MRLSGQQFLALENRAITLLGMSGVGKTTLANKLPRSHWFHYSGDYRIGTKYLEEPILDNIKRQAMQVGFLRDLLLTDSIYIRSNITIDNLQPVSTFLGMIGDPARGGLDRVEFERRQALHLAAEIGAMRDASEFIHKAQDIYGYPNFINDAGGSLCELDEPEVLETLANETIILYLRADQAMEQEVIRRQATAPKPLYYSPPFLARELDNFLNENGLASVEEIDPPAFTKWVFPRLLAHRRPRYEAIARQYGYSIDARTIERVRDENDFLNLVSDVLG